MAVTTKFREGTVCIYGLFNKVPVYFQSSHCLVLNVRALRSLPMKCGVTLNLFNGVKRAIQLHRQSDAPIASSVRLMKASAKNGLMRNAGDERRWALDICLYSVTSSSTVQYSPHLPVHRLFLTALTLR